MKKTAGKGSKKKLAELSFTVPSLGLRVSLWLVAPESSIGVYWTLPRLCLEGGGGVLPTAPARFSNTAGIVPGGSPIVSRGSPIQRLIE